MTPTEINKKCHFTGELCQVCIINELKQTQARLNHADKEIERLNEENDKYRLGMQENCELRRIAESFREQTRKALAEQYKLSVRITELERERQANA